MSSVNGVKLVQYMNEEYAQALNLDIQDNDEQTTKINSKIKYIKERKKNILESMHDHS